MQAIGRQPYPAISARDGAAVHHERHRPEQTTLYRPVQQHAATFLEQVEAAALVLAGSLAAHGQPRRAAPAFKRLLDYDEKWRSTVGGWYRRCCRT